MDSSGPRSRHARVGDEEDPPDGGAAALASSSGEGAPSAAAAVADGEAKSSEAKQAGESYSRLAVLATIFWLTMSCSQVLQNKWLFNGPFRYPVTLTSIHMLFATVVTSLLRAMGRLDVPNLPGGWLFYARTFLVISAMYAAALACGNIAAARLSVSFIHILKAITPIVTLAVGILAGVTRPCWRLAGIVTIISGGVVLASLGELLWDTPGFLLQMVAVLAESVRLVVLQTVLQTHMPRMSPLAILSLFAPVAGLLLVACARVLEPGGYAALALPGVGRLIAFNTLSAFTLNCSVMLLVGATSGLTLVLAGIIKDIIVIVAGCIWFASPLEPIQSLGYFLAVRDVC